MKKVLVALAMIMGLGTSVAFASVSGDTLAVEQTLQNSSGRIYTNSRKGTSCCCYQCIGQRL